MSDENPDPHVQTRTSILLSDNTPNGLRRVVMRAVDRLIGLDQLARVDELATTNQHKLGYSNAVLRTLDVNWRLNEEALAAVPKSGPVVFVANHPLGGIEGLILDAVLERVRPDIKLLANHLLGRVHGLRERTILVDAFGGDGAVRRNQSPMRLAIRWLRNGGGLIVFPSGEVAHRTWRFDGVEESPWSATIARLILRSRAAVVPIHFTGHNTSLFQIAGLIHPRLRTLLLPRELLNKRGCTFPLHVSAPIRAERLERFALPESAIAYLREKTLSAGGPILREPIEPAGPRDRLVAEIKGLPANTRLLTSGPLDIYCCSAALIPYALREIGRLREITFRRVGEGTGRSIDLDRFDQTYLHLFVWHRKQCEIIGAYRLGLADELAHAHGTRGLYTHTLFRFSRKLLDQLGPAIELGRSFVVEEHQRSHSALHLLWRGIGTFVVKNSRYRTLFGAVSISADYDSMTKRLMMGFLRRHHYDDNLGRMARPRHRPQAGRIGEDAAANPAIVVDDVNEVDAMVRRLDDAGRGIPVLIRQYLRLNARLLGFNVDRDFGNVIDGLFYVDLAAVDAKLLEKYLGKCEAQAFLQTHRANTCQRGQSESLIAAR